MELYVFSCIICYTLQFFRQKVLRHLEKVSYTFKRYTFKSDTFVYILKLIYHLN